MHYSNLYERHIQSSEYCPAASTSAAVSEIAWLLCLHCLGELGIYAGQIDVLQWRVLRGFPHNNVGVVGPHKGYDEIT